MPNAETQRKRGEENPRAQQEWLCHREKRKPRSGVPFAWIAQGKEPHLDFTG